MRRIVSADRANGVDAAHARMKILGDGRLRFGVGAGTAEVLFKPHRYTQDEEGHFIYDSANYSVGVWLKSRLVYVFVVSNSRARSGFFAANLNAEELSAATRLMRELGFKQWVKPGLESMRNFLSYAPTVDPETLRAIEVLLEQ